MAFTNITLTRIGESDDVTVRALIDGDEAKPIEIHVWWSHLQGTNKGSLNGDKDKIRTYIEQELAAALPTVTTIAL